MSQKEQVSEVCALAHPRTGIFTLLAHQNVNGISFFQGEYGRNEHAVVSLVVILGAFSSCSSIGGDPAGDCRTITNRQWANPHMSDDSHGYPAANSPLVDSDSKRSCG